MGGWFVDAFVEWLVRMVVNAIRMLRSRCHVADIYYDYSLTGETLKWYTRGTIRDPQRGRGLLTAIPQRNHLSCPSEPTRPFAVSGRQKLSELEFAIR
jgi:hypothetical protein